jgi:hypothetical protein
MNNSHPNPLFFTSGPRQTQITEYYSSSSISFNPCLDFSGEMAPKFEFEFSQMEGIAWNIGKPAKFFYSQFEEQKPAFFFGLTEEQFNKL